MYKNDGGRSKISEEIARKERTEFLIERINQYNDLSKTAKEVGNHLGRNAMMRWRFGDEGMVKWSESKGDHVFEMVEYYEKEAAKASRELHRIVGSSDPMMDS